MEPISVVRLSEVCERKSPNLSAIFEYVRVSIVATETSIFFFLYRFSNYIIFLF